jgi:hypothetical protein
MTDCADHSEIKNDTSSNPTTKPTYYLIGPCASFKNKFQTCMTNSDGNILDCQNLKMDYENCIEKHFTNK